LTPLGDAATSEPGAATTAESSNLLMSDSGVTLEDLATSNPNSPTVSVLLAVQAVGVVGLFVLLGLAPSRPKSRSVAALAYFKSARSSEN
jgi:hypothetical protein